MGDMSEMRGLIVLFTIVSMSISLIAVIPAGFYSPTISVQEAPDPDVMKLIAWNTSQTTTYNLTHFGYYEFQMGGYEWGLTAGLTWDKPYIQLRTHAHFTVIYWDYDYCKFYLQNGEDVNAENDQGLDLNLLSEEPVKIIARNSRTETEFVLSYNTTLYGTYVEALENDGLKATFQFDWNDRATSMNALQLVSMALTGTLPNIHPVLSVFFALFSWGLVAAGVYLAFIFVLRIVGAVFGGGGA